MKNFRKKIKTLVVFVATYVLRIEKRNMLFIIIIIEIIIVISTFSHAAYCKNTHPLYYKVTSFLFPLTLYSALLAPKYVNKYVAGDLLCLS